MLLGSCVLCVEWESNNNSWDINVKFSSHTKCDMRMGHSWLNLQRAQIHGWSIYDSNRWGSYGKISSCFLGICSKALVFRWVPFPLIARSQVLIPWDSWLVTYTVLQKGCDHSQCYLWGLLTFTLLVWDSLTGYGCDEAYLHLYYKWRSRWCCDLITFFSL